MANCQEKILEIYKQYIAGNVFQCRGNKTIPKTFKEFMDLRVEDNWLINMACVLTNNKKVALVDYDYFNYPEEVEEYYEDLGGRDEKLLRYLDECNIKHITENDGTKLYFKEANRRNAELIRDAWENRLSGIAVSLLLGYSNISIILYELYNDNVIFFKKKNLNDKDYNKYVQKYIKKITPRIRKERKRLIKLGANLYKD